MPFTPADATKYDKAASTPAKKRMWASIANAVLRKHGDDGMAIRVANSKVESLLSRSPLILESDESRQGGRLRRVSSQPLTPRVPPRARNRFFARIKDAMMRVGKEVGRGLDPDWHEQKDREAREKAKLARTPLRRRTG